MNTASTPLYEGKAKRLYEIPEDPHHLLMVFGNSLTAFNGVKKGSFEGKGALNRRISSLILQYLSREGVRTHWVEDLDDSSMKVKKVEIIPLEVVVRNVVAGSLAKRFGQEEGRTLEKPLVEYYLKNDALGDPLLTDDHVQMLKLCSIEELSELKEQALQVNALLSSLFDSCGVTLVDFKIEFGRWNGTVLLADEISPDSCRLWEKGTGEKMDKDRFRRDLGKVEEAYQEIARRLQDALLSRSSAMR